MATHFEANPAWMPDFLSSDELGSILDEAAEEVLAAAKGLAEEHVRTGEFLDSIHRTSGKYRTGRRYARVSSDDPAALSIEFGTAKSAPLRILGRAIRMI